MFSGAIFMDGTTMMISSIVLVLAGIFCLILARRGRGQEEKITKENFPELSEAEAEETKILLAVIHRRTLYIAVCLLIVGMVSGLKIEPAARLYGFLFILVLFWGNVVPRHRLFVIMNEKELSPETIRARGIRL